MLDWFFVHGGGWTSGSPEKLYPLAELLSHAGIVCCLPQYRLLNEPGMSFQQQIEDVQIAWSEAHSWLRNNGHQDLKIAFGGGSAGGHLALISLAAPLSSGQSLPRPWKWVLGNPVIDTSPAGFGHRMCGPEWRALSPLHSLQQPLGDVLFLQGTADAITRPKRAAAFIQRQRHLGSHVKSCWFDLQAHGFFNTSSLRKHTADLIASWLGVVGETSYQSR
ncbi:MAG: alpha/beta hydrolase [Verrucomicrobia bacterium]|nr:alpha/beta hydrolase [Verrucomicrobiota bacterium]